MKISPINTQQKRNETNFKGELIENAALRNLLLFVDDPQKFHKTMTQKAEQIKNIKILDRDPDFRLIEHTNRNNDYFEYALVHGHYAPVGNTANRISVKRSGNKTPLLDGAEIANKIINEMEESAKYLTEKIGNWIKGNG